MSIRTVESESESGSDGSDGSDSDGDNHRRIYLAADQDVIPKAESSMEKVEQVPITHKSTDQTPPDHRSRIQSGGSNRNRCSPCGAKKHSDLGAASEDIRQITASSYAGGCGELHGMGKCPMEEFYNQIRQWFNPAKHAGRSPGWNPVRAERSRYCIYAFVNKKSVDQGSKITDLRGNTYDLNGNRAVAISSIRQVDDYSRSEVTMMVGLHPGEIRGYWKQHDPDLWFKFTDQEDIPVIQKVKSGESRGYWKHYAPGKWFRQAKIAGKINNERGILLLDTGAEVSIVDTAFARKVGCYIDTSQIQDCVGIGESVYRTEGRTRIKITMAGSLVYFFDIWVGDLAGQDAILGMDSMVPAGIRLDLAYGSISLPDEVRIQLSGRRQLYSDKARLVTVGEHIQIEIGQSVELQLHLRMSDHEKFWVTRGDRWVPTVIKGLGKRRYLQITNVSDKAIIKM
ncbi:Hypothetical protein PHPALM_11030 [Phytophthora palmivora]|uniref:Peptidase A2 domain-containing protein n=1 Tax=Phytophthora palmivora TaxID=4796 RepID=A0A2P4Y397_9STRA|nr:Hypothetical protein PHPALM_11030 [Phytophthora palmivora]